MPARTIHTDEGEIRHVEEFDHLPVVHGQIVAAYRNGDWDAVARIADELSIIRYLRGDAMASIRPLEIVPGTLPPTPEEIDLILAQLVAEGKAEQITDPETGEVKYRFVNGT